MGVGNFSNEAIEQMGTNLVASEARKMLKSTFIVQEYVQGGALREIVIDQVPPTPVSLVILIHHAWMLQAQ